MRQRFAGSRWTGGSMRRRRWRSPTTRRARRQGWREALPQVAASSARQPPDRAHRHRGEERRHGREQDESDHGRRCRLGSVGPERPPRERCRQGERRQVAGDARPGPPGRDGIAGERVPKCRPGPGDEPACGSCADRDRHRQAQEINAARGEPSPAEVDQEGEEDVFAGQEGDRKQPARAPSAAARLRPGRRGRPYERRTRRRASRTPPDATRAAMAPAAAGSNSGTPVRR